MSRDIELAYLKMLKPNADRALVTNVMTYHQSGQRFFCLIVSRNSLIYREKIGAQTQILSYSFATEKYELLSPPIVPNMSGPEELFFNALEYVAAGIKADLAQVILEPGIR